MNFLLSQQCSTESHLFSGLGFEVVWVFCLWFVVVDCLFFSLGFLVSENLISVHNSNDWNDSIIPVAAHVTRSREKCAVLVPVWALK